ncbi:MAG: hypothetical protein AAFN70_19175, partial [Planctomycetota bacterium]
GVRTRQFEFDSNDAFNPGSIQVSIPTVGDSAEFATALADAVNADPFLNMTARASEESVQFVGGTPLSTVTSTSGLLRIEGEIGTETGFGFQIPAQAGTSVADVFDGQSITISLGLVNSVTFEFDSDGLLNDDEATRVGITGNGTLDQVIDELVRVIGGSGLGLAPTNAGFGRIFLGGDSTYSIDLTNSNATQIALPGDGPTVPIDIPLDLSDEEIVFIIQDAIDGQNLAGVTTSIVDVRVFLEGTGGVSGFGAVDVVVIQDEVGNPLQPNQADGRTELTIFIGSGFDYGDAPAPYTSLMADDGPRHRVDPNLRLGATNTADADAELPNADLSDDGVLLPGAFQAGFSSTVGMFLHNTPS